MVGPLKKDPRWIICLLFALITVFVYWPSVRHDFINYDDEDYVTKNAQVCSGLSGKSVAWAFTASRSSNWHPLTWMSHMLDCQLFGLKPAGHHLTNLLLHSANTVILFLLLRGLTGALWRSALVAALFSLHPLHVESVAWVAERKDVLSTLFFLLTLWAYGGYATEKLKPGKLKFGKQKAEIRQESQSRLTSVATSKGSGTFYYLLSLGLFALGLMSKPMVVTLPFVLLLLDYWPLGRIEVRGQRSEVRGRRTEDGGCRIAWLVLEKVPFFLLSAASSAITCWAQRAAMPTLDYLPISDRIGNALIAYSRYIGKLFWPTNLAVFYPHPGTWPLWGVIGAGVMVACVSLFVIWKAGRKPYLIVGWFWFLGTLVLVIGLVQVGSQSIADRYTYIPYIGLFIMISWGLFEGRPHPGPAPPAVAPSYGAASRGEGGPFATSRWWRFGGKRKDGVPHPQPLSHRMGEGGRGATMERTAIIFSVAAIIACMVLTRKQLGYWQDTETLFKHSLAVTENNITAYFNLGKFYAEKGRTELALEHFQKALRIKPDFADVQGRAGQILASQGRLDEAIQHYRKALELKPQLGEALNNLAWLLATNPDPKYRDGTEAVRLAERACEVTEYQRPIFVGTLAAAYAEAGRFSEAIRTAQQAHDLARKWGEGQLAQRNLQLLDLYRAGQPCRDNPKL